MDSNEMHPLVIICRGPLVPQYVTHTEYSDYFQLPHLTNLCPPGWGTQGTLSPGTANRAASHGEKPPSPRNQRRDARGTVFRGEAPLSFLSRQASLFRNN